VFDLIYSLKRKGPDFFYKLRRIFSQFSSNVACSSSLEAIVKCKFIQCVCRFLLLRYGGNSRTECPTLALLDLIRTLCIMLLLCVFVLQLLWYVIRTYFLEHPISVFCTRHLKETHWPTLHSCLVKSDLEELHMLRTGMRTLMHIESGAGLRVNWSLKPPNRNKNLNRWTAFRETLQYQIPSKLVQLSSIWNLRTDSHGQPRVLVVYICKESVMTARYWSAVPVSFISWWFALQFTAVVVITPIGMKAGLRATCICRTPDCS